MGWKVTRFSVTIVLIKQEIAMQKKKKKFMTLEA